MIGDRKRFAVISAVTGVMRLISSELSALLEGLDWCERCACPRRR
jgi:hypothetical protein